MAAHTYRCPHCTPIDPVTAALLGGLERVVVGRSVLARDIDAGRLAYRHGHWHSIHLVSINDAPTEMACRVCGGMAQRVVSVSRFNLRADGTQRTGWSSPGMCGINYNNTRARHLRGVNGETLRMSQDPNDNPGIRQVMAGSRAAAGVTI